MIVNVFYNQQGIGDTLIIAIREIDREERIFSKKDDVVRIYSEKTGVLSGFNIFNAFAYFKLETRGKVKLTEALLSKINQVINNAGFSDQMDADLSPKFVIGQVDKKISHPDADKLSICTVNVGNENLQIVCGAPNVEVGQKVVVAKVGAVMPSGLVIKPSKLRGVDSFGMLCAARELAIPDAPQEKGILILANDAEVGSEYQVSF